MTAPLDKLRVSPNRFFRKAPARRLRRSNARTGRIKIPGVGRKRAPVPPPSLRDVTVLLNVHVNSLRRFFPALCRTVVFRHREFVRYKARKRSQQVRGVVREAATKLADAGFVVTESRITRSLKKPGSMRDPVARRAYREFVAQRTA